MSKFCTGLLVVAAMMALNQPAVAEGPTENLLVNGDAELQRCTADWTAQTSVPGWHVLRGAASVLCYSAFAVSGDAPNTPANQSGGRALFGAPGADTAMEQVVDVGDAAAAIDAGDVRFDLSAWLGGWRGRPERATLTAVFLDAAGHSTGTPVVVADADARARDGKTGLVERGVSGPVPRATRRIGVTVHFLSGVTSFHNAYADNISLTLRGNVGRMRRAAALPPPVHIPALDHVVVVMMENTNFADVLHTEGGSVTVDSHMPFTASLARGGVVLSNMWGTYHPSDQNYVAMIAGDTYKYGLTYFPDYDLTVTHLGDLLNARGKSWKAYVQYMQTPCNLESQGASAQESYSPDDQPFVQFENVIGDPDRCIANVRDLDDFQEAVRHGTLPDFAWVAADNWWDGEGAWYENYDAGYSNAKQDQFLRMALGGLLDSRQWKESRSLLILTWDESAGWGWPDNRVPTILVGSPGLLRAGTVSRQHVSGYDVLRTIEGALRVHDLGRFDRFAEPLNSIFAGRTNRPADELWPAAAMMTRGSLADTFGQVTTPAAVRKPRPLELWVATADDETVVNLEPLGRVPTAASISYRSREGGKVTIPTRHLAPGVYGAWLRRGAEPPYRAPLMATVLPPPRVTPDAPGVEVIDAWSEDHYAGVIDIREGSNFGVRYCLSAGATPAQGWIGVFADGTPPDQMTQDNANAIGFWLKTVGETDGGRCGETEAFASELSPDQVYRVLLFDDTQPTGSKAVGRTAEFSMTPALPH